ncbi:hypothetical protein RBA69_23530 [Brenneria goodwinii]|uniref:hypothetical protein n=1 Tax=Brenneria goodwinii TaxID=1109412 RepID=UPI0036E5341A
MLNLVKNLPWKPLLWIAAALFALWLIHQHGYQRGFSAAESDANSALEKQQAESKTALASLQADFAQRLLQRAEREKAALLIWQRRYQQQVNAANKTEQRYLSQTASLRQQNESLKRRIDDVSQRWIDEQGKSHPVQCVFTAGFVQQYNAAYGLSAGGETRAAAVAGGVGGTSTAAEAFNARLRDSGVTQRDILAHSADAGELSQQLAAQVNGLLDYIEGLQQ